MVASDFKSEYTLAYEANEAQFSDHGEPQYGVKVHLAATYQTGDPEASMTIVAPKACATCGGIIDPLVGKLLEGTTIRWDVWTGAWEHRSRPKIAHPAVPWLPKED